MKLRVTVDDSDIEPPHVERVEHPAPVPRERPARRMVGFRAINGVLSVKTSGERWTFV